MSKIICGSLISHAVIFNIIKGITVETGRKLELIHVFRLRAEITGIGDGCDNLLCVAFVVLLKDFVAAHQ